jgi:excisionase family DNA binding protein
MKKTSKQSLALYLTVRQTATKLKVTRQDIQDGVRRGQLLAMQAGSAFLITRSSVEAYARRAPEELLNDHYLR